MTTRKEIFSEGEFYHIYNRGVEKRIIFMDDHDRARFLRLLYLCNGTKPVVYRSTQNLPLGEIDVGEKIVAIGAYCFMPNHFHLLVKEITEGGIVKFMSKLLTSYSMYFNKRHNRSGALFGGEFKSTYIDTDEYMKYMYSYIHLNPVKIIDSNWKVNGITDIPKVENYLRNYYFSSYQDYLGEKREYTRILDMSVFPNYFPEIKDAIESVTDWLNLEPLPRVPLGNVGNG